MLRYATYCGMLDLRADAYYAKGSNDRRRFYISPGGSSNVLELVVSLLVDGEPVPLEKCDVLQAKERKEAEELHLLFPSDCGAELHIVFHGDRIEAFGKNVFARESVTICPGSRLDADIVFNPSVVALPEHYFSVREAQRTLNAFSSPPPWFLAYRQKDGLWASSALEPYPGHLDFLDLESSPGPDGTIGWKVNLGVPSDKPGAVDTPPLALRFGAESEYAALQAHADCVLASGKAVRPVREFQEWQKGILACGWRYQVKLPRQEQCTQQLYQDFMAMMERNGIDFDTLIVDDFWGEQRGIWEVSTAKWPDMRGFVDRLHSQGRHILLWICIVPAGLPEEEQCDGSFNICSEAYRRRLEKCMRHMLSSEPGCLNVDGFKFDFTAQLPGKYPPGAPRNMQFLYERFKLVTDAARAVKPDCLLDYQCCNPYFAHLHNMLRLNDYFALPENGFQEMRIRAKVAKIASYGALIDTDHVSYNNFPFDGGMDFFRNIGDYGCVSLYLQEPDMANRELVQIVSGYKDKYLKRKK